MGFNDNTNNQKVENNKCKSNMNLLFNNNNKRFKIKKIIIKFKWMKFNNKIKIMRLC